MNGLKTPEDLKNLFLRYSDELYKYAYVRLGWNKEIAEDLIQDLFMKAWDKRSDYDENKGSLRTWLYAILRNKIIDVYRQKKNLSSLDENILNKSSEVGQTEIDALDDEILVKDSLAKLNEHDKDLIIMRYMQGLSNKDIAKILNKSETNIKVSIHRAINKLRMIIEIENE